MEELVSIILPVYNGEEYIEQSINSVLDQTYQNFELIIVDNNSTDKTISIIQKFSDKRINLLFCEEKGVSRARNLGLDHAKGNFITFIDADDKFDKKHIEFLIQNYNKFDNVYLSVSSVTSDLSEYKKISYKKHCPKSFVRQNFFESIIMDNHISGFVWNKMYRRDLIEKNKLRFSENILIKEDLIFNLLYLTFEREKSIVFSDIPTYFYFRHSDSATSKKRDKNEYQKYMMSIVNANELVLDILGKNCAPVKEIFSIKNINEINSLRNYIKCEIPQKYRDKELINFLTTKIKDEFGVVMKAKQLTNYQKGMFIFSFFTPNLFNKTQLVKKKLTGKES